MKKNLYDRNWFDKNWIHKRTWGKYNKQGFDVNWIHKDTLKKENPEGKTMEECKPKNPIYIGKTKRWIKFSEKEWRINKKTKTKYTTDWRNKEWYDKKWYFFDRYDKKWYDRDWFNYKGYDRNWKTEYDYLNISKEHPFIEYSKLRNGGFSHLRCCWKCAWAFMDEIWKIKWSKIDHHDSRYSKSDLKIIKEWIDILLDWIDPQKIKTRRWKIAYKYLTTLKELCEKKCIFDHRIIWVIWPRIVGEIDYPWSELRWFDENWINYITWTSYDQEWYDKNWLNEYFEDRYWYVKWSMELNKWKLIRRELIKKQREREDEYRRNKYSNPTD